MDSQTPTHPPAPASTEPGTLPSFDEWLAQPLAQIFLSTTLIVVMDKAAKEFGLLENFDVLAAFTGMLSTAIGPNVAAQTLDGRLLPAGLDLAIEDSSDRPHLAALSRCLCTAATTVLVSQMAPRPGEHRKLLAAEQIRAEAQRATLQAGYEAGQLKQGTGDMDPFRLREIRDELLASIPPVSRVHRKSQAFPVIGRLSLPRVREILESNPCADITVYTPSGGLLASPLLASETGETVLLDLVNAGWAGEVFTAAEMPPGSPTVCMTTIETTAAIQAAARGGLFGRIPGLLLARPAATNGFATASADFPNTVLALVTPIVERFRLPPRTTPQLAGGLFALEDDAAKHFHGLIRTKPPQQPELIPLWAQMDVQVLKIAALLTAPFVSHPDAPPPSIALKTLQVAADLLRYLLRGTVATLRQAAATSGSALANTVVSKLQAKGLLTFRELVRCFNNQNYQLLEAAVHDAKQQGRVVSEGGKLRAI